MNPIRHLPPYGLGVLAGLASAWLGLAMAAPAAFAVTHPTPGPAGLRDAVSTVATPFRRPGPPLPAAGAHRRGRRGCPAGQDRADRDGGGAVRGRHRGAGPTGHGPPRRKAGRCGRMSRPGWPIEPIEIDRPCRS